MSDSESLSGQSDERRFELVEALRTARAVGAPVDVSALAARFGCATDEVRGALEALELLDGDAGEAPDLAPPSLPDDYELLGELGRGGMGVVYRAHQRSLDREVAVKVLRPGELAFADALRRFRREAQALARLRHPHIVRVHEVGDVDGQLYFTMDLVEGRPLSELVRAGELTPSRSVRLLRQVASAIQYSHAHGLVHRDLKPANVLVDEHEDAFVCDFGLARDLAVSTDLTQSGRVLGTPAYMAPEQARGEAAEIGERTDVYALGALLYECLTGRAPFAGLGLAETVVAVLHEEPVAPRKLAPTVPAALERIALQALAKDPERRYPTARAFLEDLERFESGRPVRATAPSRLQRLTLWMRRERSAVGATIVTLALVALAFWQLVLPRMGATPAELVRRADSLELRGESAAALALLEEAGGDDASVVARRSALRLDVADTALRAGDTQRARELLTRSLAELEPRLDAAESEHVALREGRRSLLRLPFAQTAAALARMDVGAGEDAEALRARAANQWRRLGTDVHWLDEVVDFAWRPGAPAVAYGSGLDAQAVLLELARQAEPSLDDRLARYAAAYDLWTECLTSVPGKELLGELASREESAVPTIVALLRGLDELRQVEARRVAPEFDGVSGWHEALAAQDPLELARGARSIVFGKGFGPTSRGAALELASLAAGLPFAPEEAGDAVPGQETVKLLVDLLEQGRSQAARVAAGWVIERIDSLDPPQRSRALRWLRVAIGLPEDARGTRGHQVARERWERLLAGGGDPCAQGLIEALELDPAISDDPRALLAELERAEGLRRHRLHVLLSLVAPGDGPAPCWPAIARHEPANLIAVWRRALGMGEVEALRARVAAVVIDARTGALRLESGMCVDVPAREPLELELEHRLFEPWPERADRDVARPLGFAPGAALDRARVRYRVRARLSYRGAGRVLAWERAELPSSNAARRGLSPRAVSMRMAGGVGATTLAARLEESAFLERVPRAWVLVLSRLEPGRAADAEPWTLAEWERAFCEELTRALQDPRAPAAPPLDERLELGCWLAPPELAQVLAAAAPLAPLTGAADLAARAMAGEDAFFADAAEAQRFRDTWQAEPRDFRAWWWRLASARPAARAAMDASARAWAQQTVAGAGRRSMPLRLILPLVALGVLAVLIGGLAIAGTLREAWRRARRGDSEVGEPLFVVAVIVLPYAWGDLGGFGVFELPLKAAAVTLLVLIGFGLRRVSRTPASLALLIANAAAAALCFGSLALVHGQLVLALAALLAAVGLLALVAVGLELPPQAAGARRGLQRALALAFLAIVGLPFLADALSLVADALGWTELAAGVPLARERGDRGHGPSFLVVVLWAWWMRALARQPQLPKRPT